MLYHITIGEAGNEQGHVIATMFVDSPQDYKRAVTRAKKACTRTYEGDGWWNVREAWGEK
jgi:hypothetical protein